MAGLFPIRRTSLDWLVLLFVATAWAGYWAAYDQETAWSKVWLIVLAAMLYFAVAGQPAENLDWICVSFFCIGLGVSFYFFLTHDFIALPRKVELVNRIGRWIMEARPTVGWTPIHPNYVAGLISITTPFILYPAEKLIKSRNRFSLVLGFFIVAGLSLAVFAILMATSRGIIMAIVSAAGVWIIGWIVDRNRNRLQLHREVVFPSLVLIYLCAVVLFLYAGPANSGGTISPNYYYGTGSRGELFERSLYIVTDFPFTGGGLNAFPGLYSYYMLGIPFYNVVNSHNLFLDVAIEQGLLGGISFLAIFLISIWLVARAIVKTDSDQARRIAWLVLLALVIAFVHGMVDDYLYNGAGTLLSLALAGVSVTIRPEAAIIISPKFYRIGSFVAFVLIALIVINFNRVRSAWQADLGAVQMAKVELAGFPTDQWTESSILPQLEQAKASLHAALEADSTNRTANHRLGLISMLQGDFLSATNYLESAYRESPNHRGIIKSLGYSYAWLGNKGKALFFLSKIPEAKDELGVYVWWWDTQGRHDLSINASQQEELLKSQTHQP
jgi:O-antigen ligase